jgi:hypothetical protein
MYPPVQCLRLLTLLVGLSACVQLSAQDLGAWHQEKWFKANGAVSLGVNLYEANGIAPRRVPMSWFTAGNINISSKGFSMPFSFQFSEQSREIRQPFNQFGVSPSYKWFRAHFGWRSMSMSRYTLNNHVFLGAGIELTPGRWRIAAMSGRFLKAVQEGDSNQQVFNRVSQFPYAAFDRWGYALKLGYGTARRYVDLVYFKAKDNASSVQQLPVIQPVSPGENAAVGIQTHYGFLKYFFAEADAAISVLTRDTRSDSIPIDEQFGRYTRILAPKLSTAAYFAGDVSAGYKRKNLAAVLKASRIMPDYRSFGMYYIQTDVQRITLAPSWHARNGKIMANGSIGTEHDNLAKKKLAETRRTIGSAMLAIRPSQYFGSTFQFSNFGTSQRPGLRSISDTVVLNQVTNSYIISPYVNFGGKKSNSSITYLFSNQTLDDRNKINATNFSMTVINHSLTYTIAFTERLLNLDISGFQTNSEQPQGKTTATGGTFGLGKQMLDKKLNSHLSATMSTNTFNGSSDGFTVQGRFSNQYRINKHHSCAANFTLTANESSSGAVAQSFQEYLATLMYTYSF